MKKKHILDHIIKSSHQSTILKDDGAIYLVSIINKYFFVSGPDRPLKRRAKWI